MLGDVLHQTNYDGTYLLSVKGEPFLELGESSGYCTCWYRMLKYKRRETTPLRIMVKDIIQVSRLSLVWSINFSLLNYIY